MSRKRYDEVIRSFAWSDVLAGLGWAGREGVNLAETVIDRQVRRGRGGRSALCWIGPRGEERRVSYEALCESSSRFAGLLRRLGVGRGDRVATLMPRVPEAFAAMLGAFRAGAVLVPIFTGFGPDSVRFRLRHSGAKLLCTHHEHRDQVPEGAVERVVCVSPPDGVMRAGDVDFHAAMAEADGELAPAACRRDDPAAIIYTSGSTGQPKGCVIAVNLLAAIWPYIRYGVDLREDEDLFWPTGDPGWGYGLCCYLPALAAGATVLCVQQNVTAQLCLELLSRHGVTNLATTPTLLRSLMALGEDFVREVRARVRVISSCGEPLNGEVVEFFRRVWGTTPMDHFGATEFGLPIGNFNAIDMTVKAGSMGLPCPGHEMAVVDESGRELAAGEAGLLARRSDENNRYWLRYWNDEAASADALRSGWIRTGDLARRDDEGYFWFEGRSGDIIKSAGYRIGPFEVESAILKHAGVAEAAVVGKPDAARGEIVKAFVVLKSGVSASRELTDEIAERVKHDLGRHQYPREIEFVDELPKTQTGKIQRFLLRERG
ncbi:MAG: AMP-binding protein [Burkholderiales bacterium]|nr:AMP-binding protein [Burkholderiales bacterium]